MERHKIRQAIKVLEKAQALIKLPKHWTQYAYARDSEDHECSWRSPKAVKFCVAGALRRVAAPTEVKVVARTCLDGAAMQVKPNYNIYLVNDISGHRATLRMYRLAIASAKKQLSSKRSGSSGRQHREGESGG